MEKITSVNNSLIKELSVLKNKKHRDEKRLFLVEGYHLVEESLKHNQLMMVLITDEKDEVKGIRNILVSPSIIEKLSSTKSPQAIIGVSSYLDNTSIIGERFLLLDNIQDPGNLGTIIRSAIAFDIDQIIISPDTCDFYNDKVIRSTQGAIFSMPIIRLDLLEAIKILKDQGIVIYGTDLFGQPLNEIPLNSKYAICLGNEGNGVRNTVKDKCDYNILIEMNKKIESLNVGVAGSILMYQFYKQIK